ncbi:UDP-glucose dehydrogenase family protein [Candidatus Erwinia haradaeae]|uniref:UDP-glucose 6-dehydrogenase n=1 Tax=Candidatus Erwinia haradaeae TaxID=1922217 RepID=A0A451DH02_9GAMM|nr:UDP-glucose/GDP-mannose dehydrogenase family protein [Candidatus Erwinia haradaeae]VFP85907.1 UDP-glucose 6-dehydrogenase [Candidatus Erwinia haradaeae]
MKITVFGIGYVGLVQAAILAEVGHDVLCIDVDAIKIQRLKQGKIPIFEPGLAPLIIKNYEAGRLQFSIHAEEGVHHGLIQIITVDTPSDYDGVSDCKNVLSVAHVISKYMNHYKVILNKSTVPVGTTEHISCLIKKTLKQRGIQLRYDVIFNPEFLKEGTAVTDCMNPDRIIIGASNTNAIKLLYELYKPFNQHDNRILLMDIRSAELTKYAANCMLATKISFMNEIANLAELLGADIEKVRQGIGSDSRIGNSFIYPGCGYGGSCLPKDIRALIRIAEKIGYHSYLLKAVEDINEIQKHKLLTLIKNHYKDALQGKTFALWGLSFKPNTNDIREASSRVIMETLWNFGATIQAYDPEAIEETRRVYGCRKDLKLITSKELALRHADALIICTEWKTFRIPDFNLIKNILKKPVIFDGRNLYDPKQMKQRGFIYYAIGRGESIQKSFNTMLDDDINN